MIGTPGVVVRGAATAEIPSCIDLWVEAVAARDGADPSSAVRDRAVAKFAAPRVACVVVPAHVAAESDVVRSAGGRRLDGFALVTEPGTGRPGDPADAAYVSLVAVHPDAQARGLGRVLLAGAVAAAREAGYRRVALHVLADNHRAVRLYEAGGFLPTGAEFPHALTGTATRTFLFDADRQP